MSFKIVFTGPESTGKTTLVKSISEVLKWPWVPEVARDFLTLSGGHYDESLLEEMAVAQYRHIADYQALNEYILCDTDMLTYLIWQEEKYGYVTPLLHDLWKKQKPEVYMLCTPDIPWEPDPLRENPHDRDRLFVKYEKYLEECGIPFIVLSGSVEERTQKSLDYIYQIIK
jgi:nicotinamide riboside kinase